MGCRMNHIPRWSERSAGLIENFLLESPERLYVLSSLRLLRLYGCAVILNWFLVALLFHYLIGKRVYTLRWVSTPLSGTEWGIFHDITHSESSCVIIYYWYYAFCFSRKTFPVGPSQPVHEILLLVEQEESLSEAAYSFSTLSLTLYIFSNFLH